MKLARHLRHVLDADLYALVLRLDPLKTILAKLDPPAPRPERHRAEPALATSVPQRFSLSAFQLLIIGCHDPEST